MSAMDTANLPAFAPAGDGGIYNVTDLLTSGTYHDSTGVRHCIYPNFGDPYLAVWPEQHHHHVHYPPYPMTVTNAGCAVAEKPHETVQRALAEIAGATRALRQSAEAMGVPVDAGALEEAIVARLREVL